MTKKLEELFDLPPAADFQETLDQASILSTSSITTEALADLDKIEQALPAVKGLESSDLEMDTLAQKATESFDELMNLGMQVDSRYASEIFSVASTMLGHAITAKTAKMNKKLKMIQLQMQKVKLDRDGSNGELPATGTGHVLDRNELLKHLTKQDQPK
jgi:hypothetical protein